MSDHIAKDPVTEKSAVKPALVNATDNSLSFSHRLTVSILSLSNLLADMLFNNVLAMEKPV